MFLKWGQAGSIIFFYKEWIVNLKTKFSLFRHVLSYFRCLIQIYLLIFTGKKEQFGGSSKSRVYLKIVPHWENSFFESKKHFFENKKVLIIQKNFLWSKEIYLFTLKKFFWIKKTFFNSKNFFFDRISKKLILGWRHDNWYLYFTNKTLIVSQSNKYFLVQQQHFLLARLNYPSQWRIFCHNYIFSSCVLCCDPEK